MHWFLKADAVPCCRLLIIEALNYGVSSFFYHDLCCSLTKGHSADLCPRKGLWTELAIQTWCLNYHEEWGHGDPWVLQLLQQAMGRKEEYLDRWHCKWWETYKCQRCYLAFLEQENGPADMLWILAKNVEGHVVNLLVSAVAKKLSSHVGTLAGGRESTCRNKASHSTNSAVCMQKRGIFASGGLETRYNFPTSIRKAVSDKHMVKGSNSGANFHENNWTHRKSGIAKIRKPWICGLTRWKRCTLCKNVVQFNPLGIIMDLLQVETSLLRDKTVVFSVLKTE